MSTPHHARVAVIDIGKTNAKVVVLDGATGAEIAVRKTPNKVVATGHYPHYDVEALWTFILASLAEFAATPGFEAISITTHGASAALLHAKGELALPVLDYEFEYPQAVRDDYDRLRPDFAETCSPRLSGGLNLGAQLHFQKASFPEDFGHVATILTYPQYWAFRLTGVAANEATSLGCHTDLWRPGAGQYSALVDRLDIRSLMAPVRPAFDALGPLLPEICDRIGLAAPVPVHCGIHDSNASLLPHLLRREAPFAVVSTGTWVVCFAVGGDLDGLDPTRDTLANVDAYGRAVPSARFMGGREYEMLTEALSPASAMELEEALAAVLGRGVMVLPNIASGSGPFPGRKTEWLGVAETAAERQVAASLYAALMTATCLVLIGNRGPIIVEGPFAGNAIYLRALATAAGCDVIVLPGGAPTGTAQGAGLLTGIALAPGEERLIVPEPELAAYCAKWRRAVAERG
ncbi:carbohydrate kinase [Rhizobium sp. S-51]|uniref:Carbohydrate kinase n=1 Tax=Rhizobium terricola TaxID=2728849 RepID=A0A7Y0B008_9HYPH|nr:FGGY-family carbohydrate kinase [Rhizobium terricola]NML76502.1 carbohydrate kinase [Rhizobium terricola]